jgi:uncharacterized membrane protein
MRKLLLLAIIILLLDSIYLKVIGPGFSKMVLGIQKSPLKLNMVSAGFTYLLVIVQLYYFIIERNGSLLDAFLLGMTTYGIFDFTSISVLKDYSIKIGVIDMLWGGILYTITTYILKKI